MKTKIFDLALLLLCQLILWYGVYRLVDMFVIPAVMNNLNSIYLKPNLNISTQLTTSLNLTGERLILNIFPYVAVLVATILTVLANQKRKVDTTMIVGLIGTVAGVLWLFYNREVIDRDFFRYVLGPLAATNSCLVLVSGMLLHFYKPGLVEKLIKHTDKWIMPAVLPVLQKTWKVLKPELDKIKPSSHKKLAIMVIAALMATSAWLSVWSPDYLVGKNIGYIPSIMIWLPAVLTAIFIAQNEVQRIPKVIICTYCIFLFMLLLHLFEFCRGLQCLPGGFSSIAGMIRPEGGNYLTKTVYSILGQAILMPLVCGTMYIFGQEFTAAKIVRISKYTIIHVILFYVTIGTLSFNPVWVFTVDKDFYELIWYLLFISVSLGVWTEFPLEVNRKAKMLSGFAAAFIAWGVLNIFTVSGGGGWLYFGPVNSIAICIIGVVLVLLFVINEILKRRLTLAKLEKNYAP